MTRHTRRHPRGKVNPVSVLTVAGLVAAGWWGFHYLPLWMDNLDVREAIDQGVNIAQVEGDAAGFGKTIYKLNNVIGWHYDIDEESGQEVVKPGLGIDPDTLTLEHDSESKTIIGHLEYDRVIQLKPLQRRKAFHFVLDKRVNVR